MLLTRPPLATQRASSSVLPFDLHVLGLPPAFNLSHDQTLQFFSSCAALRHTSAKHHCLLRTYFHQTQMFNEYALIGQPSPTRKSAHTYCLIHSFKEHSRLAAVRAAHYTDTFPLGKQFFRLIVTIMKSTPAHSETASAMGLFHHRQQGTMSAGKRGTVAPGGAS